MRIPLSRAHVTEDMKAAVLAAIDSGRFILGPETRAFEEEFAAAIGTRYAVAVSNGTSAIQLTLLALGVGPGQEVLVPSHTAFPTVEAVFETGATPVFVDIDATYTVAPSDLEAKITARTVGMIPVNLYGHPVDVTAMRRVADRHRLFWIEDSCQSHGATSGGKTIGSFGDAGAFSFYPSKNLTVFGDGGMVTTNREDLAQKIRRLRDHGRSDKYTHEVVGYNMRFNEIQASVGRVQLRHLDDYSKRRRELAQGYAEALRDVVQTPPEPRDGEAVYHLYVIQTDARDALASFLKEHGIETGIHYPLPNHRQPATLARIRPAPPGLPETERIVPRILSLPMFYELSNADRDSVAATVRAFFGRAA
jgi:dTDP-4-amino-4,6-dideoxygalactose transaminase